MKIVFMGTPDFAVSILDAVADAGHEIAAVVTQPDRPKGRGGQLAMSDVKLRALSRGFTVLQPERVRKDEAFQDTLREIAPDVIVVAAFGQILPPSVLEIPRLGCVNVHASLLPRYRGAAPIQWAVINGDAETGVTTMQMDEGLDTGDILEQLVVPIEADETGGSLFDKLADAGAKLIVSTLRGLEEGSLTAVPQDDAQASYTRMLSRDSGKIDWAMPAGSLECLIRGLDPWPSAYTVLDGKIMKIWKAERVPSGGLSAEPGTITALTKDGIQVRTGDGDLLIRELQVQGKKRMDAAAFLRGHALKAGERFEI